MSEGESDVIIRSITQGDFDAILALGGNLICQEDLGVLGSGGLLDSSFVAENAGQIIGFNLARIQYVGIPLTKLYVIECIVVEHEYRRYRVGHRLIEEV